MSGFPSVGLTTGPGGLAWTNALAVALRMLPLTLVVATLAPALVICPFLGSRHQCFLLRVLTLLMEWAAASPG